MFPSFDLFPGITIYTFGLSLSIAFFLFFGMLYKLSVKFGINTNFFLGNVLLFFVSIFLFSRLFHIIAEWRDFKFIINDSFWKFLFMPDYNFSLMGGIFGFLLILLYQEKKFRFSIQKYIDACVLAFLFAAIVGFLGAFLGGQIYGKPTDLPIGISYALSASSIISSPTPLFPLAIIYAITCFVLFSILYPLRMIIATEGLFGYLGIILFSCVLLIFEQFNGSDDIFRSFTTNSVLKNGLDLNQIGSLFLILYGFLGIR